MYNLLKCLTVFDVTMALVKSHPSLSHLWLGRELHPSARFQTLSYDRRAETIGPNADSWLNNEMLMCICVCMPSGQCSLVHCAGCPASGTLAGLHGQVSYSLLSMFSLLIVCRVLRVLQFRALLLASVLVLYYSN